MSASAPSLYVVIVHGTRISTLLDGAWWWKRQSGTDFPFCEKLEGELSSLGISGAVWGCCRDFDVEEFAWSGQNDHYERLKAASQLATYLNRVSDDAEKRYGRTVPIAVIAHSHGGNVFLASVPELAGNVRILAVFFLGTPFLYIRTRPYGLYFPLYMRKPTKAVRDAVFHVFHAGLLDEVQAAFSFTGIRRMVRRELDKLLPTLRRKRVGNESKPYGFFFVPGPGGGDWVEGTARIGIPLLDKVGTALARVIELISVPVLWIVQKVFNFLIAGYLAKRIRGLLLGLPIEMFKWGDINSFTSVNYPQTIHYSVPTEDLTVNVTASTPLSFPTYLPELEMDWTQERIGDYLSGRVQSVLVEIELVHTQYYKSPWIIREIASCIWGSGRNQRAL